MSRTRTTDPTPNSRPRQRKPLSQETDLPPGPRGCVIRAAGLGDAPSTGPRRVNPYDRAGEPLSYAAWSLGYARGRARVDPAGRPSTIDAATDPAAPYPEREPA